MSEKDYYVYAMSAFTSTSLSQTTLRLQECGHIQGFVSLLIDVFQMYSKDGNIFPECPEKFLQGLQCLRGTFVQSQYDCIILNALTEY